MKITEMPVSFTLPQLPYDEDALTPHITQDVVKYHYGKHTRGYFEKAAELAKGTIFEGKLLEDILTKGSVIKMDTVLFNNVSQAWNHTFYWNCLAPVSQSGNPSDAVLTAVNNTFGSLDEFKKEFSDKGTKFFGSGWVWLVFKDGHLQIKTTPNAGSPLTETNTHPLLTCDLWEHAHYLQYPADRASYIKAYWNVVNWNFVNSLFDKATSK